MIPLRLTKPQARRIALAAQLIGRPKPVSPGFRDVTNAIDRLAQFQIDSVNVLARAHLMPLFSRLGAYDVGLLTRAAEQRPRRLFEYWGHAASLIDTRLAPALRPRMLAHVDQPWNAMRRLLDTRPTLVEDLYREIADRGPLTSRELAEPSDRSTSNWWGWSDTKAALEWLFYIGRLSVAGRTQSFERRYDIIERVLPLDSQGELGPEAAHLELIRRSAVALGIGSVTCLGDYFRLSAASARRAIATLEQTGELVPATVQGWNVPLWVWHAARRPRTVQAATIVAPFDSLVFERKRLEALFDMRYRIEIYVPEAQRQYGYYVYPFVFGDSLDARVDLKADRASGRLLVQSSWLEASAEQRGAAVASALADNLREVATWLGLGEVEVRGSGNLAGELARHC